MQVSKKKDKNGFDAVSFLGKEVVITVDRPAGSPHPNFGWNYPINYGYIEGIEAPDGDYLDAYFLTDKPCTMGKGLCIAIVHRLDDIEDKLVVAPKDVSFTKEEIEAKINFQEKYFKHNIITE